MCAYPALAEPAGTARLMGWLPLVAIALGALLGFDTLQVLLHIRSASRARCLLGPHQGCPPLERRTRASGDGGERHPGWRSELFAIAVSGGVSLERAATIRPRRAGVEVDAAMHGVLWSADRRCAGRRAAAGGSGALERHRARVDGRLRADPTFVASAAAAGRLHASRLPSFSASRRCC